MNDNGNNIEARLWDATDALLANSKLKSSEYTPDHTRDLILPRLIFSEVYLSELNIAVPEEAIA